MFYSTTKNTFFNWFDAYIWISYIPGRLIGITLLHGIMQLIQLCRHVVKYMLGQEIRWHDLAFFDSEMYENLRKLFLMSQVELEATDLNFEVRPS